MGYNRSKTLSTEKKNRSSDIFQLNYHEKHLSMKKCFTRTITSYIRIVTIKKCEKDPFNMVL